MAMTPQEANAAGLNWVDEHHPMYGKPGFAGYQAPAAQPKQIARAEGLVPQNNVQQQGQNAQTYSGTPGAAPSANTTNQGSQDVVRNSYLQQATQGTKMDRNDPAIRQQSDAFAAAQTRQARNLMNDKAEQLGPYATGALRGEQRVAAERAGQAAGGFEAALVGRELENRRNEIKEALANLQGMISQDQQSALQRELAALEAQLKREGLSQSGSLGQQDLSLRDKLGVGSLNVDMMRALLQNQQFGQDLGFRVGQQEYESYMDSIFGRR